MSAVFDAGPLTWVKSEIDSSLERARGALRAAGGDPAQLKACRENLHQASGAVQIVGLEGVSRFFEETESLIAELEAGKVASPGAANEAIERAILAIGHYLSELLDGRPDQPLRLFPAFRDLVQARGAAAPSAAELFFPNLAFAPPPRDKPALRLPKDEMAGFARNQRAQYQRGFLKWLREPRDAQAIGDMRAAVDAIEETQSVPAQRSYWWAAGALIDALGSGDLGADAAVRQVCTRIEQHIRRMGEGSGAVAERALREALYWIARAGDSPASARVRAVQRAFHLRGVLPEEEGEDESTQPVAAVHALREATTAAKEAWNRYAAGAAPALAGFARQARIMVGQSAALGNDALLALAREIVACADALQADPPRMSDAVAMEVATALLVVENSIETERAQAPERARQAGMMTQRLGAVVLGRKLAGELPGGSFIDEMTRRAQEKLALGAVLAEMQGNLQKIEQALDAYFRDPSRSGELAALESIVHQVSGAMRVLGEDEALAALERCAARMRDFAAAAVRPALAEFEDVAQTLSGLGFYIEALKHGKADFATAMQPMRPAPLPVVEEAPADDEAEWAEPVAAAEQESAALPPPDAPTDGALRIDMDAAPPATAEDAQPPGAASAEAIDRELLEIFLEEAQSVLADIGTHLDALRLEPAAGASLGTIRRGFHTLKGSGRMVGLARLGDAAWALEQVMNHWMEEERAADAALLELVARAHADFGVWVAKLVAGESQPDGAALIAAAEQVKQASAGAVPVVDAPATEAEMPITVPPVEVPPVDAPPVEEPPVEEPPAEEPPVEEPPVEEPPVEEPPVEEPPVEAPPAEMPAAEAPPVGTEELEPALPQAPASAAVAVPAEEETVAIGEARLSSSLFAVFTNEARQYLDALERDIAAVAAGAVVSEESVRVAHTLGGICGTAQIRPMHMLGHALEGALLRLRAGELPPAPQACHTLAQATAALREMFAEVLARRLPAPRADLAGALDAIVAGVPAHEADAGIVQAPGDAPAPALLPDALAVPAADDAEREDAAVERRTRRIEDDIDTQLLPIFLEEAQALTPQVGEVLRAWRREPGNAAHPEALQRVLHTFKGSARMAGAMRLGELTHYMETRVENAAALRITPAALFDDLEQSSDRMNVLLEALQAPVAVPAREPGAAVPPDAGTRAAGDPAQADASVRADAPGSPRAVMRVRAEVLEKLVNQAGEVSITRSRVETEVRALKAALGELIENVGRLRQQLREIEIQAESQMQAHSREAEQKRESFDPLEFDRFTRFQEITRMMAESVSDVGTVQQAIAKIADDADAALAAQARLNRELQQDLMSVRMVPVRSIAERLHRLVRQTSKELGKRTNFDLRGEGVEVDRSVLERIVGPLEHLLRNAITHGIEAAPARLAAGKSEAGEIRLEVRQEGQEVTLTLIDDGAGLDFARIRERALAQGLLGEADAPGQDALASLIFLPGFSTAGRVTEVAGRGVGMDVVKKEVSDLGGRIELSTTPGQGTRFLVRLPLTTAVIQAVLVRAGERVCALPSVMVEQLQQLRPEQLSAIREAGRAEWAGRGYPFAYLPELLGEPGAAGSPRKYQSLLLLRAGAESIALLVDEMLGNQEVVVKNIGPQLARVPGVTGASVLGSGEIVLILNPVALAARPRPPAPAAQIPVEEAGPAPPRVLVVDDSLTVRKVTGRLLAREGYEVLAAKDGVEALELLADIVPDAMLVDIEMPRMDGFDLTRNVRGDARLKNVPIIMITSRTAEKHRGFAAELGVNVFLGKPFQEDELLAHLAGFTGR